MPLKPFDSHTFSGAHGLSTQALKIRGGTNLCFEKETGMENCKKPLTLPLCSPTSPSDCNLSQGSSVHHLLFVTDGIQPALGKTAQQRQGGLLTSDGPKHSSISGTRAGAVTVLFCLWLLQMLLECAWTPGSPLREAPIEVRVGRGEEGGKVISIIGHKKPPPNQQTVGKEEYLIWCLQESNYIFKGGTKLALCPTGSNPTPAEIACQWLALGLSCKSILYVKTHSAKLPNRSICNKYLSIKHWANKPLYF